MFAKHSFFVVAAVTAVAVGCHAPSGDPGEDSLADVDAGAGADAASVPDAGRDGAPAPLAWAGPNWAVIDGPRVPTYGSTDVSALRKRVELDVAGAVDGLVIGDGHVMRSSETSSFVRWAVRVDSHADRTHCFVRMTEIAYRRADGNAISTDSFDTSYVTGTIRDLGGGNTDTCVRPGETAYFLGIDELPFDDVARIEFRLEASPTNSTAAAADVVPHSYLSVDGGGFDVIEVVAQHRGGSPATLARFSKFLLLGSDNEPLFWTFLDEPEGEGAVVRDGDWIKLSRRLFYDGSGMRIVAWLEYAGSDTSDEEAVGVLPDEPDARAHALAAARNRRAQRFADRVQRQP